MEESDTVRLRGGKLQSDLVKSGNVETKSAGTGVKGAPERMPGNKESALP